MGKILVEWLHLYKKLKTKTGKRVDAVVWGRKIVEFLMRSAIEAWESQNQLLHKAEEKEQESPRRCAALVQEICQLQLLQEEARPVDDFLFLEDCDKFIKSASIRKMADYILMVRRPIKKSIKQWKNRHKEGIVSVRGWLRTNPGNSAFVACSEALERRIKLDRWQRRSKVAPINDNTQQRYISQFFTIYDT